MKDIFMCEVSNFNVNYIINPWMNDNVGTVVSNLAHKQWNDLVNLIKSYSKVNILSSSIESLPDLVFTANSGICLNKNFITSCFSNIERKPESNIYANYFKKLGFTVDNYFVDNNISFEGAGDALYSKKHNTYVVSYGFRTQYEAYPYLRKFFEKASISSVQVKLVNPKFYHLDTCFCPLDNGFILYYPEAFSIESQEQLVSLFGNDLIAISKADADYFACNGVSLNNKLIVNDCSDILSVKLKYLDVDVLKTPMSEFLKSGGSCKCLTIDIAARI